MKSKEEIIAYLKDYRPAKVKFAVTDLDGILRGKVVDRDKFLSLAENGSGFCDVVFGWDSSDVLYDHVDYTGWHTGYPDAQAKADLSTFRTVPWENGLPFFMGDFFDQNGQGLSICPRSLLKKIKQRTEEAGFAAVFSQEFEWFNFRETPESLHQKDYRQPQPLTPGMFGYSILRPSLNSGFFHDLFDEMKAFGVPLEGLHTETGPGVYEAAIMYADVLEAADRAVLFKTGTKQIAYRHGIMASFMAKWNENLPGCGGHIHQSLWDADKQKNLFYDKNEGISNLMKSYIAGQLYCLPHVLPMYAPTINSFKRLVEGAWAPTTLTWGIDNRTTTLRALPGSAKATRLETRVVGADVNPYLAMAACLASGLYGIQQKMKLEIPATQGNGYLEKTNGILPGTLEKATALMKNSEVARELFGDEFVTHFVRTREWECQQYAKAVTDWELKRYFEII
jgi:glutamine synthetase